MTNNATTPPPHQLIASIHQPNATQIATAITSLDPTIDLAEIRLDALWTQPPDADTATQDLIQITDAATTRRIPLLGTLRPQRQGGHWDGPEEVRISLLIAAGRTGFAALDLENDLQAQPTVTPLLRQSCQQLILSDHRPPTAPSRDDGLNRLLAMQDLQAHHHKLAFPCGSFADQLRALELVHAHANRGGSPAIAPIGAPAALRALLAIAGNSLTYGHAPGNPPAIQGQPSTADIHATWNHWGITPNQLGPTDDGAPPWLAILGNPINHSLSPRIHNAALEASNRPERYGALEVPDSIGAVRLITMIANRIGLRGASITMPLKEHAAKVATPDEVVQAVGASNCLRFTPTGAEATNTDATAMIRLLKPYQGSHAIILGAGGAARAAMYAAQKIGMKATFTSRNPTHADATLGIVDGTWVPWQDREKIAATADIIIQATPLGSHPNDPTPLTSTNNAQHLIELVYASGPTPLQQLAETTGITITDGRTFLVEQARDAYTYWTGETPDTQLMMEAVRSANP